MIILILMSQPLNIVSFVACVVIVTRWKKLGPASLWALSGFGLTLALGIAQIAVMVINAGTLGNSIPPMRPWAAKIIGMSWPLLHAIAYVLLLVAIFAGRSTSTSSDPPAASAQ